MVIFGKCRKGSRSGEKLVTIPKGSNIEIGDSIMFRKIPLDDFDNLFKEVKEHGRKKN